MKYIRTYESFDNKISLDGYIEDVTNFLVSDGCPQNVVSEVIEDSIETIKDYYSKNIEAYDCFLEIY